MVMGQRIDESLFVTRFSFTASSRLLYAASNHSRQFLEFIWNQLLRNRMGEHMADAYPPLPLYLENLYTT